ncbi:MAG: TIGR01777 family protein [Flavobacterium sp.]|nr:MAG: TIGR01777 family protein [Flavobacterium sp.]
MKILVTGASGLVGKALLPLLESAGHEVICLTTSPIRHNSHFKQFSWNPARNEIDETAVLGVSAIIHLAGASISKPWTKRYRQQIIDSRVDSAKLLYKQLQQSNHSVKMFISASAIGIYPDSTTEQYTESSTSQSHNFLGDVVHKWEAAADEFQTLGIQVDKIRTGLVLDSRQGALPQIAKPIKAGLGAVFGSGNQLISWIHINDLVRIYLFVLENKMSGIINATAPNPAPNTELTKKIANIYDRPLWLPNIPEWLTKPLLGERSVLLYSGQRVIPQKLLAAGFTFLHPEIGAALDSVLKKSPRNGSRNRD